MPGPCPACMPLVRADEMHLAGQDRAIAHQPQMVREGRHAGGELGGVVIGADGRRQLPRQHREA